MGHTFNFVNSLMASQIFFTVTRAWFSAKNTPENDLQTVISTPCEFYSTFYSLNP